MSYNRTVQKGNCIKERGARANGLLVVVPCRVCVCVWDMCLGLGCVRNLRIWAQNLDEVGFWRTGEGDWLPEGGGRRGTGPVIGVIGLADWSKMRHRMVLDIERVQVWLLQAGV